MISPELLRQYPFFGQLNDAQLKELAMIAEEFPLSAGKKLFEEGEPAGVFYLLLEGRVDLFYDLDGDAPETSEPGVLVGTVNPGEPLAISALLEPYIFTATAWVSKPGRAIKLQGEGLRSLFSGDRRLAYLLTREAAKSAMQRLYDTRVLLAAALA
jgi:CRP-like cAMP-binding protein